MFLLEIQMPLKHFVSLGGNIFCNASLEVVSKKVLNSKPPPKYSLVCDQGLGWEGVVVFHTPWLAKAHSPGFRLKILNGS